jgi:hypothetical protein
MRAAEMAFGGEQVADESKVFGRDVSAANLHALCHGQEHPKRKKETPVFLIAPKNFPLTHEASHQ